MRWLVAAVAIAGCYSPQLDPCTVHCTGPDDVCPDGMACAADDHRHLPDDTTTCTTASDFLVRVHKLGAGTGDVTSDGDIDCGTACTVTLVEGDTINLSAVPGTGMLFDGWTGDCTGVDTCKLTADADKVVNATFDISELVNVTFTGPGDGGVSSSPAGLLCDDTTSAGCSASYAMGTTLVLTPMEINQSFFNTWGGDCAFSQDFTCTIQVTGPLNISLDFQN